MDDVACLYLANKLGLEGLAADQHYSSSRWQPGAESISVPECCTRVFVQNVLDALVQGTFSREGSGAASAAVPTAVTPEGDGKSLTWFSIQSSIFTAVKLIGLLTPLMHPSRAAPSRHFLC